MQCLSTRSPSEVSWKDLCRRSLSKMSEQDRCSLHQASVQDLYQRSSGKILCKNSIRALLARSLTKISRNSRRGLLARSLYKLPTRSVLARCLASVLARSLRSRTALRHFTRAILCTGKMPDANPATSVLCEPAQSKSYF